ncbi:MAG: nucleoside deaminase [Candidatus Omnitrophica bacterium]|nr:nucleoside deaminase [Candidatus Omnitrophota bacterium]
MQKAFKQALYAKEEDEVPVGAVIVHEKRIIAQSYNQVEKLKDPTAHAEMLAITQASSFLGSKWLHKCTLYVTLEPCAMCAGALILSRIPRLVFGAKDPKAGAFGGCFDISDFGLNHKIRVIQEVLKEQCSQILADFFKAKRKSKPSHIC